MNIRPLQPADEREWRELRHALWPDTTSQDHAEDLAEYLAHPESHLILVAALESGGLAGFVEVRLRSHVDGCRTSPVGFLEGWYVATAYRRQGVGGALVRAAEAWARGRGCREMGSDTWVDNTGSRAAHQALGFEEGSPVVTFRKSLEG
ncbi:MAG: aminoglycoside 6'-N-acetyltransferase [Gemmatimonadota bacterium]|nr:aminoglycoside 6'-N-acetyltransferase [Gemmatimonadota bacterium]